MLRYKFSKVKVIHKSRKFASFYKLPFSVRVLTVLSKMGFWVHILIAIEIQIVIVTLYFQTVIGILSFFRDVTDYFRPKNAAD